MRRIGTQGFQEKLSHFKNGEYELIGEYVNNFTPIKILHKKCGNIFTVSIPYNVFKFRECPICSNKWKRDNETFSKELNDLYNNEFSLVGEYKSTNSRVLIKHNKCGHIFSVFPREAKGRGVHCPICYGYRKGETSKTFQERLDRKYNGQYELLSEYKKAREKVLILCKSCGTKFYTLPDNIINKGSHGCPYCNLSRGEKRIEIFFQKNNIKYKNQYLLDSCKNIRALRFDFAIFDNNEKLLFLLEYDGKQHFIPVRFNSIMTNEQCEENLEKVKYNDSIKNDYCEKNKISLYRIKYTQYNKIEEILKNILSTIPCYANVNWRV